MNLTASDKEAVSKLSQALRQKRKAHFFAESKNGKLGGVLTLVGAPEDSSWLRLGPANRQG